MINPSTKICKKCGLELPNTPDFFSVLINKRSDGTDYVTIRGSCKKCKVKETRTWQTKNPDKFHANENKRQALMKNAPGNYTKENIEEIKTTQNNQCYYCRRVLDSKQQVDHKIPLSKGGTNYPANLVLACHSCNLDKHGKGAKEFFERRVKCNLPINKRFHPRD